MIGAGLSGAGAAPASEEQEFQFIGNPSPIVTPVPAAAESAEKEPVAASPAIAAKRLLVLHYHTFKNAGSSFDETLLQSFGPQWGEQEFDTGGGRSNAQAVEAYLRDNPQLKALSSHTALLPLPRIDGVHIFPVFFVRHPILRLRSAYLFERAQGADTFGSRLASGTDFRGYIEGLLDVPSNRQARDFHAYRLAFGNEEGRTEAERAFRTLRSLPFVGLVEAYDASLRRLDGLLSPYTDDFRPAFVRRNVTAPRQDLGIAEQLEEIRAELGDDLYIRLEANNLTDLRIFEMIAGFYALPSIAGGTWMKR